MLCLVSQLFLHFKSPHLLQMIGRMLQHFFPVKLQKYFVDYNTSPDFPSA